jgi:hypothetical protein
MGVPSVKESYPEWSNDLEKEKGQVIWVEEEVTPDSALDHLLDQPKVCVIFINSWFLVNVHMYIYIYTHTHIYIYTYIHTYMSALCTHGLPYFEK